MKCEYIQENRHSRRFSYLLNDLYFFVCDEERGKNVGITQVNNLNCSKLRVCEIQSFTSKGLD